MDLSGSSRTPIPANQVVSVNPDSAGHRGVLVVSHDQLRPDLGWPLARLSMRSPSLRACARRGDGCRHGGRQHVACSALKLPRFTMRGRQGTMTADHQRRSQLSGYEGVLVRVLVRAGTTASGRQCPSRQGFLSFLSVTVSLGNPISKRRKRTSVTHRATRSRSDTWPLSARNSDARRHPSQTTFKP
jgi:hypothetical protein